MKVTTEPREDCQLGLTIEVDPERVEAALAKAAKNIANKANIPGFRKGKAPRHIIEQLYGKEALLQEAIDDLGQEVYREALDQTDVKPYGPGQLEDIQRDPLVLKMLIPLPPKVELGDYRSVRLPFEAPSVGDEEIVHQLEHLRDRHAIVEPAPEGATADWGHLVNLDVEATVDGQPFIQRNEVNAALEQEPLDGRVTILPGFDQQVIGMAAGEQKTFSLPVPQNDDQADYGDFAGKTADFNVTLKDVRLRTLPDADDALAQTVGDFETIDALRDAIRNDLQTEKQRKTESDYADRVVDAILATAQIEFPPLLIDDELDAMLERTDQRLRGQGMDLDAYLKMLQKTRDEYREELRPTARERLKRGLLLSRLVALEQLDVAESEIDGAIEATSAAYGQRASQVRDALSSDKSKQNIQLDILTQKALSRLSAIAKGEAPALTQPVAEPA